MIYLDIFFSLKEIQNLIYTISPILSATLFMIAGLIYAIGQLLPPYQRATFHTMAINIIIGAIVLSILTLTANGITAAVENFFVNNSNSL